MKPLYTRVAGSRDAKRHLIRASGEDSAFPRAVCQAGIRLRDDSSLPECADCLRISLTEIALALNSLGRDRLGVKVAAEVRLLSYGNDDDGGAMAVTA